MIWFVPSLLYQINATPLYVASESGHHDVVKSLLGAGAEVNIATSDVSDVTCVHRVHVHVYCGVIINRVVILINCIMYFISTYI